MADWEWTKREKNKALAAVSTLKRALGVANHPSKTDEFATIPRNQVRIYTPDKDSAELMGELLYRYGNDNAEKFYDAHPELSSIRDSIRVKPLEEGGFVTYMQIYHPRHFNAKILKMASKHISADEGFKR